VLTYLIRRVLQSVPLFFGVSLLAFFIIRLTPGGPLMAYEDPRQTPEDRRRLEQALGLDQPLPVQYLKWLNAAVQLDLGRSYIQHRPVVEMIAERLPATMLLIGTSMVLGIAIGIPAGVLAAMRRGSVFDNAIRVLTVVGSAVPHWWLGLLLIVVLAANLHLLPSGGMYPLNKPDPDLWDRLRHLILPASVLATGWWVGLCRFVRSQTLDVLGQDHVRTAWAKGLTPGRVALRHVLRNALIPVVTIMGGSLAALFGGAALTENIFSWPGIGTMTLAAATNRDYPVILGVLMIGSGLVIVGNLLADLTYGLVDPRVRYE
jgi:peptide/nickel transport system permease protein